MRKLSEAKIAAAAIKMGDQVYTGKTHFEAMHNFLKTSDLSSDDKARMLLAAEDGFLTDEGDFVDRHEAFALAANAKQLIKHEYSDPAKNMAFFNTDKPSLDSGLVQENYVPVKRIKANVHLFS